MTRRRILIAIGAVALVAVLVIGLSQSKEANHSSTAADAQLTDAQIQKQLQGAPPKLAALHAQAGQILTGNAKTVKQRIASFKGTPVVVNMWGSWCGPCVGETPLMGRASAKYGKKVAFIGLDVKDNDADAAAFLKKVPVGYPSYSDPDERTTQQLATTVGLPTTVFYTADGKQNEIHQGPFLSSADLDKAIQRYALGTTTR
jgi:thiol-disulfide isomerase/thioredoxin